MSQLYIASNHLFIFLGLGPDWGKLAVAMKHELSLGKYVTEGQRICTKFGLVVDLASMLEDSVCNIFTWTVVV